MNNIITNIFQFTLLFIVLFIGDYTFAAVSLIFPVMIVGMTILVLQIGPSNVRVQIIYFLVLLIVTIIFGAISFANLNGIDRSYDFWFVIPLISFVILLRTFTLDDRSLGVYITVMIYLLFALEVLWLAQGGGRGRAIFGPNILYRVYLFLIIFTYFSNNMRLSNSTYITAIFGIILTGSRGAFLCLIVLFLYYCIIERLDFKNLVKMILALFLILFLSISYFGEIFANLVYALGRIFVFSGESVNHRISFLSDWSHFVSRSVTEILFGLGTFPNDILWFYPHNFFFELAVSHGLFLCIFFILCVVIVLINAAIFAQQLNVHQKRVAVLTLMYFIASSLSGNFFDNWPLVALPFVFASYTAKKVSKPLKNQGIK